MTPSRTRGLGQSTPVQTLIILLLLPHRAARQSLVSFFTVFVHLKLQMFSAGEGLVCSQLSSAQLSSGRVGSGRLHAVVTEAVCASTHFWKQTSSQTQVEKDDFEIVPQFFTDCSSLIWCDARCPSSCSFTVSLTFQTFSDV